MKSIGLCYYCAKPVTKEEHDQVEAVVAFWMGLEGSDHFEPADMFVHMAGVLPVNTDIDSNVIVCPTDAIREMSETLGYN